MAAGTETDTIPFHPGIHQLLSAINRIVETNREKQVFLRDLINNASDALDQIRSERLKGKRNLDGELFIRIVPNKASNTLTIIDNGVGMTKSKLVKLGTIPRPGTRTLWAYTLADASKHSFLWWMTRLGFYTAYFVAEKVAVTTKRKSGEQYVWEARAGCGSFSVTRDTTGENLGRGTKVTLYLKDDQSAYLDETLLGALVKKHSQFISYQIFLKTTEKDPFGSELSVIHQKPIWTRKPEDVSKEEYTAYYRSLMKGVGEVPLAVKHFSHYESLINGVFVEFKTILFVPRGKSGCHPVDLVNISIFQDLIPKYLSFVRGIVDSEDVPLRISRVMHQRNKIREGIRENLVNKCFELFSEIAENEEDYGEFYKAFSENLKRGMSEDSQNGTRIAELLRYRSTESGDELTSLKDYVTRMKEGQSGIYYIILLSWNKTAVENSHVLKDLKKKGYEVLFMVDDIDRDVAGKLEDFEGKKLQEVRLFIGPVEFKSTLTEEERKHYEKWLERGPEIMPKVSDVDDDCNCIDWSPPSPRMNPSDDAGDDCYDEHEAPLFQRTRFRDIQDEFLTETFRCLEACRLKLRVKGRL
ncbi:hypothetical protein LUZ60_013497 [Juncus effusus]|nr:hypothetical protein LUZ60_013497 [Juncus effusus]